MTAAEVVGAISIAISSATISHFLSRKKHRAEVDNIATEVLEKAVEYLRHENAEIRKQIENNREYIEKLERNQEDCDEKARIQNIELAVLRRWIVTKKIESEEIKIFIMDDDDYVRYSFKERFERISITKVDLFRSIEELDDQIYLQPDILILDYYVDHQTIDGFMSRLLAMPEYYPKVIVISGMYKMQADKLPYKDRVTFVSKNEDFVSISVNAVMNFIEKGLK